MLRYVHRYRNYITLNSTDTIIIPSIFQFRDAFNFMNYNIFLYSETHISATSHRIKGFLNRLVQNLVKVLHIYKVFFLLSELY